MKREPRTQHRVVLITGASRGIGRAIAENQAQRGATVVLAGRAHRGRPDRLDRVLAEIELRGGHGLSVRADVREPAQVDAMVKTVLERLGRIDVLINNAGVFGGELSLTELGPQAWHKILDTNLTGAFLCARAVAPAMCSRGSGTIVNISSGAAVRTGFLNIAYGVSKAGLDRLSAGLAAELGPAGITCLSVSPPATITEATARLYSKPQLQQWTPPEVTAGAIALLLDDPELPGYSGLVVSVREYLRTRG